MLVAPGCRGVEWLMEVVLVGVALSDLGDQWEVTANTIFERRNFLETENCRSVCMTELRFSDACRTGLEGKEVAFDSVALPGRRCDALPLCRSLWHVDGGGGHGASHRGRALSRG